MPIPANQITVAEVILYGQIASSGSNAKNTANVFHFRRLATAIAPSKASLDTAFQAAIGVPVIAALNIRWGQLRNTVRWLNDAQDGPVDFAHVNAGGTVGDSMATHEAVYIQLRTALKGRSFRGSKHFGPLSETDTTIGASDVLNAAAIVKFGAIVTALGTDIVDGTGNTWRSVVYSRLLSFPLVNPTTIVNNDVTQVRLNTRVGDLLLRKVRSIY